VGVGENAAVETTAAGATAVKVKFVTTGIDEGAVNVVREVEHQVFKGAAGAVAQQLPKMLEGLAKLVAVPQVRMRGELGDGEGLEFVGVAAQADGAR